MTTQEISVQFDVLYDNISSGQAPGLTEYEKSVFLTKAQNEIVKNYFNPKGNKYQEGFDGSPKRQIDFSRLLKTVNCNSLNIESDSLELYLHSASNSKLYALPDDIFVYINEFLDVVRDSNSIRLVVTPITFDVFNRLMLKPFKRPLKNQAWRLICNSNASTPIAQLIPSSGDEIAKYIIRYIKKPTPIILEDLEEGLSIDGKSEITECELDPILHEEILQRAVELAKATYIGDVTSTIELGNRSE